MNPAQLIGPGIRYMVSESTGVKIPAIAARGMVFTAWQPSREEVEAMEAGHPVWLIQRGSYIPEMSMLVGMQQDIIPRDLQVEAMEDVSPDKQRMMERLLEKKESLESRFRFYEIIFGAVIALGWGIMIGYIIRRFIHG